MGSEMCIRDSVSLFPFHSWAAPAYASAPTPVAMLHAGVLKKIWTLWPPQTLPSRPRGYEALADPAHRPAPR